MEHFCPYFFGLRIEEKIDEAATIALEESKKAAPVSSAAGREYFQKNLEKISYVLTGVPTVVYFIYFDSFLELAKLGLFEGDHAAKVIMFASLFAPYFGAGNFVYLRRARMQGNETFYDKLRDKLKALWTKENDGGFRSIFLERIFRQSSPRVRIKCEELVDLKKK